MILTILKIFICQLMILAFIFIGTLIPTEIRGRAFKFSSSIGRIGGISMPLIMYYLVQLDYYRFIVFLLIESIIIMKLSTYINHDIN